MTIDSKYSLIIGDVNKTLPIQAKKRLFDLIIADPPFGISFSKSSHEYGAKDYDLYKDDFTDDTYLEFSKKWIKTCYDSLTPTGSLYIISGWTNLQYILNAIKNTDICSSGGISDSNHNPLSFSYLIFPLIPAPSSETSFVEIGSEGRVFLHLLGEMEFILIEKNKKKTHLDF